MTRLQTIGFDLCGTLPVLALHLFEAVDGQLVHSIDDRLRAIVPAEGWDDYLATFPAAAPVVDELRAQPAPVQVVFEGEEGKRQAEQLAAETAAKVDQPADTDPQAAKQ